MPSNILNELSMPDEFSPKIGNKLHVASMPCGEHFTVTATLREVNCKKLVFDTKARVECEQMLSCVHEQLVFEDKMFLARVSDKKSRIGVQ